ncbi:MAG: type III-B CRISPR module-associated protein Cmr3, partial [Anaerolineales bacterium]
MSVWIIEPRDPIIFRDGKPFSATPGAWAKSLPFPYPSTIAGAVRTRAGQDGTGIFDTSKITDLLKKEVRGPVLVELNTEGQPAEYLFPAPADCLIVESKLNKEKGERLWVRPIKTEAQDFTNLKDGLLLVSPCPVMKDKPLSGTPRFWKWKELENWLLAPKNDETAIDPKTLGISGLTSENRMHVKIAPGAQTAEEGMLFQTSGLEFASVTEKKLSEAKQYALAVETDASLTEGVDFLGGERRMVNWRNKDVRDFPPCHEKIKGEILRTGHCRLILATPALFTDGYLPKLEGMPAKVIAAAVPRGTAVSGWDYATKQQKASRRLAPAGSVYFLK